MLSCSTAYLSRIERGTAQVSEILIVEISKALNIEKNWFFPNKLGVGPLEIAPTLNSEEVFTLHEGAKVLVLDTVDNWKKIKLVDGKLGWIIAEEIKEL